MPRGELAVADPWTIKAKVCLVGEIAVGKTSLVRRFSLGTFDEVYSTTLGVSVSKKTVQPPTTLVGGPAHVDLILYDVMGQRNLRELLLESYFKGAQALLAVWDITRPKTLGELRNWIEMAQGVTGPIPVVFATNKMDLSPDRSFEAAELEKLVHEYGGECFATSAKTGENVEAAFERIAADLVRQTNQGPPRRHRVDPDSTLESRARERIEGRRKRT